MFAVDGLAAGGDDGNSNNNNNDTVWLPSTPLKLGGLIEEGKASHTTYVGRHMRISVEVDGVTRGENIEFYNNARRVELSKARKASPSAQLAYLDSKSPGKDNRKKTTNTGVSLFRG